MSDADRIEVLKTLLEEDEVMWTYWLEITQQLRRTVESMTRTLETVADHQHALRAELDALLAKERGAK